MIGIQEIGSYIPQGRVSNYDRRSQFHIDDHFIEERLGVARISVKGEGERTSDLAVRAFEALRRKSDLEMSEIECMAVVGQNPDHNVPHVSAVVHGKLDLRSECACFDVSLGCSGFVYGLSVLEGFMQRNGMRRGVLITADPYSAIVDQSDRNTALLFGDAATAALVSDQPRLRSGKFSFGTLGKSHGDLICRSGKLHMNGRAIFDMAARQVPASIRLMLKRNGLELSQVDKFLLHQASKYMLRTVAGRLRVDPAKMPFAAREYGNTVSSSIPLLLEPELRNEDVKTIVISGFGVGLSWSSGVLFRV